LKGCPSFFFFVFFFFSEDSPADFSVCRTPPLGLFFFRKTAGVSPVCGDFRSEAYWLHVPFLPSFQVFFLASAPSGLKFRHTISLLFDRAFCLLTLRALPLTAGTESVPDPTFPTTPSLFEALAQDHARARIWTFFPWFSGYLSGPRQASFAADRT